MLRLLSRILDVLSFDAPVVPCDLDLIGDPVFQAMSPRDRADLPFPRSTPRGGAENEIGAGEPQPLETHAARHAA